MCHDISQGHRTIQESLEEITGLYGGSKCRFMTYYKEKLYITDLGLDKIYIWDIKEMNADIVEAPSRVMEPCSWAGTAVDDYGNLLIADYKNNRLCVVDERGDWVEAIEVRR